MGASRASRKPAKSHLAQEVEAAHATDTHMHPSSHASGEMPGLWPELLVFGSWRLDQSGWCKGHLA